jgi:hypothetical protein
MTIKFKQQILGSSWSIQYSIRHIYQIKNIETAQMSYLSIEGYI